MAFIYPHDMHEGNWSRRFIAWIEAIQMEKASGNVALKVHLEELHHIRRIVVDLNRNIRALSRTDEYRENVRFLKIVPGISTLSAMTFLTELYHISRFRSLDQLASYVGLIPDTDSSGEKDISTGITKRRNSVLRGILIESAWIAARKDPALTMAFEKLCTRMTKTHAIVRIAKKLLNRIRYILKNQMEYVPAVVQ